MPAIEVDGQLLFYETRGEGGPRVLLIMGMAMTRAAWQHQVEGLSEDHRLGLFDNRGVGDSAPLRGGVSMGVMADDAAAVLDALRWEDAHVVGVSMGGMIAQHLALRHRARLRSLTLIATQPGGATAWLPKPQGSFWFLRSMVGSRKARLEAFKRLVYPRDYLDEVEPEALDARLAPQLRNPPTPTVRRAQISAVVRHDARPHLERLEGLPTLVVKPEADILVPPARSEELVRRIPGACLVRLPGAGHGCIAQRADEVNGALRGFIAEVEGRGREAEAS